MSFVSALDDFVSRVYLGYRRAASMYTHARVFHATLIMEIERLLRPY